MVVSMLETLVIQPASEEQKKEIVKHVANHWGSPEAGLEYFVRLHQLIETKDYAIDGKLVYWVLVPQDDRQTLGFYSCCRTYRRDIAVLSAGSQNSTPAIGYVVSGVVTPPEHRGRGYAQRMISLLHYALAPHIYSNPSIHINVPPSVLPATVAVLYSDVGNYYARCGPLPEAPGFTITSPMTTTWTISASLPKLTSANPVELLTEKAVHELLKHDIPDLTSFARPNEKKVYFAIAPSFSPNLHLVTRSAQHSLHNTSSTVHWGARCGKSFITWSFNYSSPRTLQITRLDSDASSFLALLMAAFKAGERQGCQVAEAWNVPDALSEVVDSTGGTTCERKDHLPAVRWYGPADVQDVVWVMNEYYAWA